jgi:hypothetical protein
VVAQTGWANDITLETTGLRLTLNERGVVTGLDDLANNRKRLGRPYAMCTGMVKGEWRAGRLVSAQGGRLIFELGPSGPKAAISAKTEAGAIVFQVEAVDKTIESLDLFRIDPATPTSTAASRLLWYPDWVLGLVSGAPPVRLRATRSAKWGHLRAFVYRDLGMVGQKAALFGCRPKHVRKAIGAIEKAFDIPLGIEQKSNDANRRSYLMIGGINARNADRVVGYGQRGGFGSVLVLHGTWAHFGKKYAVPKSHWPGGLAQLKGFVDKVHKAGMLSGAHMFSSKVPKYSDYTHPRVDRRLYQDHFAVLAKDIDAKADRIVTTEPPKGWPQLRGTRDILVDNELIAYTDLSLKPPYGFLGCQRGRYGTKAGAHKAGAKLSRPVTDESRGIFIIDPKTDMLDEVADNIARTFEGAGFDWIYFDGAEDVPSPHWCNVPIAKLPLLRRLKRKPPIVQCAAIGTFGWNLTTRAGQRDYFWQSMNPKDEVDDAITRGVPRVKQSLYAAEIGWFPIWRASPGRRATQIDDIEYLYTKALAADAAVSILTSASRLDGLEHREAILYIMNQLERLRVENYFSEKVKERVRQPHQDFMLLKDKHGKWRLQPAREVPFVGGTSQQVRVFKAAPLDGATTYSLWSVGGKMRLEFDCLPGTAAFTDFRGKPYPHKSLPGARVQVDVDRRLYMKVTGRRQRLRAFLRRAKVTAVPPKLIFLQAETPEKRSPVFAVRKDVSKALGKVLVPTADFVYTDARTDPGNRYTVDIPHDGIWNLWVRVKYADTGSNSFYYVDAQRQEKLGNTMGRYDQWFWDGGLSLPLKKGRHTFHIAAREGKPGASPMLDALCLADAPAYVPKDREARRALMAAK